MGDEPFPSGPWTGFYNYRPGDRHRMDLHLSFENGSINGEGNDDVGPFLIKGRYDPTTRECRWTKSYIGRHDVSYRGFGEGKGIWGTWEIQRWSRGGFHIWPRGSGEGEALEETAQISQPADAIAIEQPSVPADSVSSHTDQPCQLVLPANLFLRPPNLARWLDKPHFALIATMLHPYLVAG